MVLCILKELKRQGPAAGHDPVGLSGQICVI